MTDAHKQAFRKAFDLLKELWPPENSVEFFAERAYPACAVAYREMDGNPLGQKLVLDVYWYLGDEAMGTGKEEAK